MTNSNKHRDKRLDSLIGEDVIITFFDGDIIEGELLGFDLPYHKPKTYVIRCQGKSFYMQELSFRKSYVSKIETVF